MDQRRFQQVKELVLATLDQAPEARDAFLRTACPDDSGLRREVEALLVEDEPTERFLAPLPLTSQGGELDETPSRAGQRVGVYEIEELIGAGGMGEVYRARRVDDYQQIVALKLVRQGRGTAEALGRFKNEMQLLAAVGEHPNIAQLFDAGTTDDGSPYFVMEYVDGHSIDRHCDQGRLTIRERLELFCAVCRAVQFAHQHAVIHRDIKPSNILITRDGTPKLIDFGIAKLTTPDTQDRQSAFRTAPQARVMTPHYASPEQMRGEGVSTATDIYSLGVVLYELLSGHRPYELSSDRPIEWATIVCETNPRRPSTVLGDKELVALGEAGNGSTPEGVARARRESPRRLARALRGDLDNIVLMALRKEVERRYASVDQFADDVSRHLQQLPVRARRDSFGYRATRFLQRNRVAALLGLLVLASLVVGIVGTASQAIRAERSAAAARQEALRANREAEASHAVANLLAKMFEANAPHQLAGFRVGSADGSSLEARLPAPAVLARSAAQVRDDLSGRPRLQATLLDSIGNAYVGLGQPRQAEPLLTEALAIRRQVLEPEDPELIVSLQSMAWLRFIQGRFADAEHHVRELLRARQAHGEQVADTMMAKFWLAAILSFREAHHNEIEELLDEVIAWRREHLGPHHPDVAYALVCRAINQANQQRTGAATLATVLEAGRIFAADDSTHELGTAIADVTQSAIQATTGNTDRAIKLAQAAFETGRRTLGEQHAFVEIFALYTPRALELAGKRDEAESLYQAAADRLRAEGRSAGYFYARHLAFLSLIRARQQRHEEGEQIMDEAIAIFCDLLGDESYRVVWCQINRAGMLRALGRYDKAIGLTQQAIAVAETLATDGYGNVGWCRGELQKTLKAKRQAEGTEQPSES